MITTLFFLLALFTSFYLKNIWYAKTNNVCIRAVYDTKSIQEDESKKLMAMKNVVLFVILAK